MCVFSFITVAMMPKLPIQNNGITGWCLIRCFCVSFNKCRHGDNVCFVVINMAEGMALSLLIKKVEG